MEFETLDLGDKRRNKRAIKMMAEFGVMPTASIPQACGDWADIMGAYRLFQNDAVEWVLGA
jgi:Transposase DNA-binding